MTDTRPTPVAVDERGDPASPMPPTRTRRAVDGERCRHGYFHCRCHRPEHPGDDLHRCPCGTSWRTRADGAATVDHPLQRPADWTTPGGCGWLARHDPAAYHALHAGD